MNWNLLFILSVSIFAFSTVIMIIFGFIRNRYYHTFHEDEMIKSTKTINTVNKLYFTYGETTRFIKKYVVCKSAVDKYVIVNYNKEFENISFFILCYGLFKRPFKVFKYSEKNTGVSSQLIVIPRRTKSINVVICSADNQTINYNVIKPLSLRRIKLYSLFVSLLTFSGLLAIRHLLAITICGHYIALSFMNSYENYLIIILSFVLALVVFFVTNISFKKKNKKNLSGGAVEYEFL